MSGARSLPDSRALGKNSGKFPESLVQRAACLRGEAQVYLGQAGTVLPARGRMDPLSRIRRLEKPRTTVGRVGLSFHPATLDELASEIGHRGRSETQALRELGRRSWLRPGPSHARTDPMTTAAITSPMTTSSRRWDFSVKAVAVCWGADLEGLAISPRRSGLSSRT